jgi:inositol transport system substrate-binding protein
MQKVTSYKCPHCGVRYKSLQVWGNHVQTKHPDMIPEGWSYGRYFYYVKTGKKAGSCVVCKNPTEWNESTMKYARFCNNPDCKTKYREMFKGRMINKYGKVHLLDDPEQQRKMLANKHISGQYTFLDGTKVTYTGTYELDFLKFIDRFLHFNGDDIMMPSPHTYYYEYKNPNDPDHEGQHFYVPDAYIPSLNLEIEIKQNTNMHHKLLAIDRVKELQKDEMMTNRSDVNYLKIVEKNYVPFIQYLEDARLDEPVQEAYTDDVIEAMEAFLSEIRDSLSGYDFDSEEKILEAAGYSKEDNKPVFIILTSGNTPLAKLIKKSTGDQFSHSSISFDISLNPLYSFGAVKAKFGGPGKNMGFIKTTPDSDLWYTSKSNVPYAIYVTHVSSYNIEKMKSRLEYFVNNQDQMRYSYSGLVRVFFNLKSPKRYHWFCSAFVAEILNAGKPLPKDPTLYRPQTLTSIDQVDLLCTGRNIVEYDEEAAKKALKLIQSDTPVLESGLVKYRDTYISDISKYMNIRSFKFGKIDPMLLKSFAKEAKGKFSKIRVSRNSFGELVIDGKHLVGYYNTEKRENLVWLQAFEICGRYRGQGLSVQLLDRAIKKSGLTNIAINPANELALKIYQDYGFIEYSRTDDKILLHYERD